MKPVSTQLRRKAGRLMNRPDEFLPHLRRHRKALRLYRDGRQNLDDIEEITELSRQTIWRIAKNEMWPQPQGGRRPSRSKIPVTLYAELWEKIQRWREVLKPYAKNAVAWLNQSGIHVTTAAIHTWICRLKKQMRKTRKSIYHVAGQACRREALREAISETYLKGRQSSFCHPRTGQP